MHKWFNPAYHQKQAGSLLPRVLPSRVYKEVISNTESVTQSTLSATLAGTTVSPEGGEGTDSLFKKMENIGRKTSWGEWAVCFLNLCRLLKTTRQKELHVCREQRVRNKLIKPITIEETVYEMTGNRRSSSGETEEQRQKQADGGGRWRALWMQRRAGAANGQRGRWGGRRNTWSDTATGSWSRISDPLLSISKKL